MELFEALIDTVFMHNIWKAPTRPSTLRIYWDTLKQASKEVVYEIWTLGPRRFFTFESSSRHFQQWERDTILNIVYLSQYGCQNYRAPMTSRLLGRGMGCLTSIITPPLPTPTHQTMYTRRQTDTLFRPGESSTRPPMSHALVYKKHSPSLKFHANVSW